MTPSDLILVRRWVAARIRLTLRTPRATFFTFVFPLMFLVSFNGIFGLTLACYSSVIFGLAEARDSGLLKRVRGTPLPMPVYLGSWLTGAVLTGIASVLLMFVVAVPVFGVHIYARTIPAAVFTLVLGAATLAALGIAVASLVRKADQAMPVAQLTFLPVSFISGIWFPLDGAPDWLVRLAHFFPLAHIVDA